ncbi:MAG: Fis family transcriptional regulator [candidate division Zixibacteria bacterium 4484_95]|nr:MAG: Fis family transcriptional regulator [candidate division Zixibacteria bacterium 4484_95]
MTENRKKPIKKTKLSHDEITAILDSVAEGVFTVDENWRITSFNRAAQKITGVPEEEAVGSFCFDVFKASICETDCALRQTMKTGKPIINKAVYIINAVGKKIPISISTALLKDKNDKIIGGVETFRDLSMVEQLRKELKDRYTFEDIVSKSPNMKHIFNLLPLIANSDSTVVIMGESGTGKELLARAIHNLSYRHTQPFVIVNCGALPDTLLESELFGYKAGAFTDAKKDKPGRFTIARNGTIFLDEIGDISPALQVKLLRVLQDKTYEPLGSVQSYKSRARIIAATNKDLPQLVKEGKFRQDLYYRINVVKIEIPPLRQRREDIPLLLEHFIYKFNKLKGKEVVGVSPDVMKILMNHNYPGNVRELENIIEHAFAVSSENLIKPQHLPEEITKVSTRAPQPGYNTLSQLQKQYILNALERNNWNRYQTAKELGIHKTTLYRKIRKLGIDFPEYDGRSKPKE